MKKIFMILAIMAIYVSAYSQFRLSGVVEFENLPLPGASITVGDKFAVSDSNGYYSIENIANGDTEMIVYFIGLKTWKKTIILTSDEVVDINMVSDIMTLEPIEVSALRAKDRTPFTYSQVTKEDLEKVDLGQDVPYLLEMMPSVVVTSDAGTGIGYSGIRVRGSDPTRVNVTINGIPYNDAESQGTYWVDLPDFAGSVEDIQLQRGVGTSSNGGSAFGATLNLNTNKVRRKRYVQLANTIGSYGTLKNRLAFGTGLLKKGIVFDGRLAAIQSDGYIDRGASNLRSWYASGAYINDHESFRLNAFGGHEVTYQAWNGVPGRYLTTADLRSYNSAGTDRPDEPYSNEVDDYKQNHVQFFYNRTMSSHLTVGAALHYTRGYGFYENYKSNKRLSSFALSYPDSIKADLVRRKWLDNHFKGFIANVNYETSKFTGTFGLSANSYKGDHYGEVIWIDSLPLNKISDRYYNDNADKSEWSSFLKLSYNVFKGIHLFGDMQVRSVKYEYQGQFEEGFTDLAKVEHNFINPKFGAVWQTKNHRAYASLAYASKEPNRNDYVDNYVGNSPKPEKLRDIEIGYTFGKENIVLGVNYYNMFYKDQLVLTGKINDVGEYTRINVPKSCRQGVEFSSSFAFADKVKVGANATFSKNKIRRFTEYIDNWDTWSQDSILHEKTFIAFSPSVVAGLTFDYDFVKSDDLDISTGFSFKYVGEQYMDNTSNDNSLLGDYLTSDFSLRMRKKIGRFDAKLNFTIKNLLNTLYSSNGWIYRFNSPSYNPVADEVFAQSEGNGTYNLAGYFPQAPRHFLLGLNIEF